MPLAGGRGVACSGNNYLAEQGASRCAPKQKQNVGKNTKKAGLPRRSPKAKAGAPRGNTNALKHGDYAAANIARYKPMREYCARMCWTAALVNAMVDARANSDAHLPLLRAVMAGGMQHGGAAPGVRPRYSFRNAITASL